MAKLNLNDIESLANNTSARQAINANFEEVERFADNTLSRDGSTPNQMGADIDLNSNDLLNVNVIDAMEYRRNGLPVEQEIAYANKHYQLLSGNGVQTVFTLDFDPGSIGNLEISIAGVIKRPILDFTYVGTTLTFASPPANAVNNILVRYDTALPLPFGDSEAVFFHPPGSSLIQSVNDALSNGVYVTWFASPSQLATDATAATQAAVNYAISSGRRGVYFPGGITYKFLAASAPIDPGTGDMTFFGDGLSSVIQFEEGASLDVALNRKHLFRNTDNVAKGTLEFKGLHFKGTWTAGGFAERGGCPLFLWYYTQLRIINCRFYDLSWAASSCENIGRVFVNGNHYERCVRDMVRMRSSFNVIVTDNHFKQCDDDAIALHQWNTNTTPGTQREGIVIADNQFEDCGPVRILAGRMVSVTGNVFRRSKSGAILVYEDSLNASEGEVPMFAIDISSNQIYDLLNRAPFATPAFSAIAVYGRGRKSGTNSSNTVPGEPIVGDGGFIRPWDWRTGFYSLATDGYPPIHHVRVQNNTIARTLPAVAEYDDWGYGQAMSASGFSNDDVTNEAMRPTVGINIEGDGRRMLIQGNIVGHVGLGILFNQASSHHGLDQTRVTENVFSDCNVAGIEIQAPAATRSVNITVAQNDFDCDPYHNHTNRVSGGAWTSDTGGPFALIANNSTNWSFERNRIKNVSKVYAADLYAYSTVKDNLLRCQPAVNGFHATNKGIGFVELAGVQFNYEVVNSDPSSADYGQNLGETLVARPSIPTTGLYVQGTFVQHSSSSTVWGWVRLTTGTGHVSGTDWKTVALT